MSDCNSVGRRSKRPSPPPLVKFDLVGIVRPDESGRFEIAARDADPFIAATAFVARVEEMVAAGGGYYIFDWIEADESDESILARCEFGWSQKRAGPLL